MRGMRVATAVTVLTLAAQVSGQCRPGDMQVRKGPSTYQGANIIMAGQMMVAQGTGGDPGCNGLTTAAAFSTTGNIPSGGTCEITDTQGFYAVGTATCTGTTWTLLTLTPNPCTNPATITNGDPAMITTGNSGDTVVATCAMGFSCVVTMANPTCETTCEAPNWNPATITCTPNCPITTSAAVTITCVGFTTTPTTVPEGTQCTIAANPGYICTPATSTETCDNMGTAITAPATCDEIRCQPYAFKAGEIQPAAGGPTDCFDMVLLSAVSLPSCSVTCDVANGYTIKTWQVTCPTTPDAAGNYVPASPDTCEKIKCPVTGMGSFTSASIEAADTTACSEVGSTACTMTCAPGYAVSGGAPTLTCTQTSPTVDTASWVLANDCVGPGMCDTYTCPDGLVHPDPASQTCPTVTALMPYCTAGDAMNTMRCCPNTVPCPANAALPTCACDAGYTGTPAWSGTAWTHTCDEVRCPAYALGTGFQGTATGGCVNNIELTAVSNPTCSIECMPGYVDLTVRVTCDNTGAIVTNPAAGVTCTAKLCSAYTIPADAVGGGTGAACTTGIVLSAVPTQQNSCGIQCRPGYSGAAAVITCPTTAANGAAPSGSITCTENRCKAYVFPVGAIAGGANPCVNGTRMRTNSDPDCTIVCAPDYDGAPATIICPDDAADNADTTGGITCTAKCTTHTCSMGFVAKPNVGNIVCTGGACTDAVCCDAAGCPADASPAGVCNCDSGFLGTPQWDAGTSRFTHTCTAHCDNANTPACPPGLQKVPNPATVSCSTGTCTATSCPVCTAAICCEQLDCTPPLDNFPAYQFGNSSCTTVSSCGTIACAVGYRQTMTGTAPTIRCPSQGSAFVLSGCEEVPCPAFSSGIGECNCNAGYAVVGGGGPNWDATTNTWRHTCAITCGSTAFTGCSGAGLQKRPNADTLFCSSPSTDVASCTAATCCVALCSIQTTICPAAAGLLPKPDQNKILCSGPQVSDCGQGTCCDASCDHTGFAGCDTTAGWAPLLNPQNKACTGGIDASRCDPQTCCKATICGNFNCNPGTSRNPAANQCSGSCTNNQCCLENTCNAITGMPELDIQDRTCARRSECGTVVCAPGYSGTAKLECPTNNGDFVGSGCTENTCQQALRNSLEGYTLAQPCTLPSACGAVACAPGWSRESASVPPTVICPSPNAVMQGSGCKENECIAPNQPEGELVEVTVENPSCTKRSDCGRVACSRGYSLPNTGRVVQPTIGCITPNQRFETDNNCEENTCLPPNPPPAGYVIQLGSTCTQASACGLVSCAAGYTGTPQIVCVNPGGSFELQGCTAATCPTNSGPEGTCECDQGYSGTPRWNTSSWIHTCTAVQCPLNSNGWPNCVCDPGFTGSVTWSSGAWDNNCVAVTCPANTDSSCNCLPTYYGPRNWDGTKWTHRCERFECAAPGTQLAGAYNIPSGNTCTRSIDCGTITCISPFVQADPAVQPYITCTGTGGQFIGGGCGSANCPANSGPADVCTCNQGFSGRPNKNPVTNVWAHTCGPVDCPANAALTTVAAGRQCTCNQGYTGSVWDPNTMLWSPCTLAACPPGAQTPRTANCDCPTTANGLPQWDQVNGRWTHTCGSNSGCPQNAFLSGTQCVCSSGFRGTLTLVNGAWTGVCSPINTCPLNAVQSGTTCTCRPGFFAQPPLAVNNGIWSGACVSRCPANAAFINNVCQCNGGFTGTLTQSGNTWTGTCIRCPINSIVVNGVCTCSTGFFGTPTLVNGAWTGVCTSRCPPNAAFISNACQCTTGFTGTLSPPAAGSNVWTGTCTTTTNTCLANAVLNGNACTCLPGFFGTPTLVNGAWTGVCTSRCPANAAFSNNACQCTAGFRGTLSPPAAGSNVWTGTCSSGVCPLNAALVNNVCRCNTGFTGTLVPPTTSNAPWTGTCSACPANAALINNVCTCSVGFFGNPAPTLVNGVWTGSCASRCPTNAFFSTASNSCQCNTGFTGTLSPPAAGSNLWTGTCGACPANAVFVNNQCECGTGFRGDPAPTLDNGVWTGNCIQGLSWLRMDVRGSTVLQNFDVAAFKAAVRAELGQQFTVQVYYVCISSRCPLRNSCPTTQSRIDAGCEQIDPLPTGVTQARRAVTLQTDTLRVDFDVFQGSNQVQNSVKEGMAQTLNTEILSCPTRATTTGETCPLTSFAPVTGSASTAPAVREDDDDDDGLPWWAILLIALGVLLCCLLLLFLLCCCRKKKKKGTEETTTKEVYEEREMYSETAPEDYESKKDKDEYTSYNEYSGGSEDYYNTSYVESQAVELEFIPDEVISAQYIDGQYYDGTIWSKADDGTYNIRWADGSHSEGVPGDQIRKKK